MTRRSNRPGRSRAESSTSGRLVAASTTTPSVPVKPSISVRIWLSVCSRSSTPPRLPPPRARPIASSSSMKMIAGAAFFAVLEQVAHPGRADADDELDELGRRQVEERHVGLAGHRPGQQRLAGAGRAGEQDALRDGRAERACTCRVAEEVDDLGELVLHLVDAGDVGERGPRARLRLVPLGPRSADPAEAAEPAAGRRHPPEEPDAQADEQQRRAEADQDLGQQRHLVRRLGVDGDVLVQQQLRSARRRRRPAAGW